MKKCFQFKCLRRNKDDERFLKLFMNMFINIKITFSTTRFLFMNSNVIEKFEWKNENWKLKLIEDCVTKADDDKTNFFIIFSNLSIEASNSFFLKTRLLWRFFLYFAFMIIWLIIFSIHVWEMIWEWSWWRYICKMFVIMMFKIFLFLLSLKLISFSSLFFIFCSNAFRMIIHSLSIRKPFYWNSFLIYSKFHDFFDISKKLIENSIILKIILIKIRWMTCTNMCVWKKLRWMKSSQDEIWKWIFHF